MNATDGVTATGITAAGSYGAGAANVVTGALGFPLKGGRYVLACVASAFGTNLTLQMLGPDGATWVAVPAVTGTNPLTAAGALIFDLPGGQYRFTTTGTFTAGAASIYSVRGQG